MAHDEVNDHKCVHEDCTPIDQHAHEVSVVVDPQHDPCDHCIHVESVDHPSQIRQRACEGELNVFAPAMPCGWFEVSMPWALEVTPIRHARFHPPDPEECAQQLSLRVTRLLI